MIDVGGADDLATWVVRAVNIAPSDLAHRATRLTQMEEYWAQFAVGESGKPPSPTGESSA